MFRGVEATRVLADSVVMLVGRADFLTNDYPREMVSSSTLSLGGS